MPSPSSCRELSTFFDRYVVVDWSARNAPATGADSIWIAELAGDQLTLSNPSTRRAATDRLHEIVERCGDDRLLLGFDASLGYPAGTARSLGLTGTPWEATWRLIADLSEDDQHNRNNRFDVAVELNTRIGCGSGPFWGRPPSRAGGHLAATKPPKFELGEFRLAEQRLRERGLRPASGWQLLGAGSVGSQTLTLLPMLVELRSRSANRIEVWPFTTGLTLPSIDRGAVTVVEVWPTMFDRDRGQDVKDASQVSGTARHLQAADLGGDLGTWFAPEVPQALVADVVGEEGWVLGPSGNTGLR